MPDFLNILKHNNNIMLCRKKAAGYDHAKEDLLCRKKNKSVAKLQIGCVVTVLRPSMAAKI